MTIEEIIRAIQNKLPNFKDIQKTYKTIIDMLKDRLLKTEDVELQGFSSISEKNPRTGRYPKTREEIDKREELISRPLIRKTFSIFIIGILVIYIIMIISGYLPKNNRLDGSELIAVLGGIMLMFLLLSDQFVEKLKTLKIFGIELELKEKINNIELFLKIILPDNILNHLKNLSEGNTKKYDFNERVAQEFRSLRNMNLITLKNAENIQELVKKNKKEKKNIDISHYFDLSKYANNILEYISSISLPN